MSNTATEAELEAARTLAAAANADEPTPAPFAPRPVLHAQGWCDGPSCKDPHHAYMREMLNEEEEETNG